MNEAAPLTLRDVVEWHRKGDYERAIIAYRRLLRDMPDNPLVWTNLGAALRSTGHLETSILCHRRALYHGPKNATAIANLGNALRAKGSFAGARSMALIEQTGMATGPSTTVARDLQGMGHWRASIAAFDKAIAHDPQNAELRILRATSYFMIGDFEKGLADYSERFRFSPGSEPKRMSPRWDGGPATGKRLLVMSEQGLGDMVLASRFMPKLRETWEEVWLTSREPTLRLFDGVPYIDRVIPKGTSLPEGEEDAHIPAMELMRIHDMQPDHCPAPAPLNIPQDSRDRAAQITAPYRKLFKVGICWAGSPTFVQAKRKATEFQRFLELADIPGVQLFGMCKGEREKDIEEVGAEGLVVNTAATDRDFADAAALCEHMDLVITVDTGLGHVAGALGCPTWILLARPSFWYWGPYGENTYWYDSVRLIRQSVAGDWSGPFATIRADLEAMVS